MKVGFMNSLVARSDSDSSNQVSTFTPTMQGLVIALLVLVIIALLAVVALFFLRRRRQMLARDQLPQYEEKQSTSRYSNHRRLNVRPSESIYVYQEKQNLIDNSDAPSTSSPVPEIRITFPEEVDEVGKRKSGRVVVVRVGETSVGLEPVSDEKLPPYQQSESDRFQSLDLERIGGLREKEAEARFA